MGNIEDPNAPDFTQVPKARSYDAGMEYTMADRAAGFATAVETAEIPGISEPEDIRPDFSSETSVRAYEAGALFEKAQSYGGFSSASAKAGTYRSIDTQRNSDPFDDRD